MKTAHDDFPRPMTCVDNSDNGICQYFTKKFDVGVEYMAIKQDASFYYVEDANGDVQLVFKYRFGEVRGDI